MRIFPGGNFWRNKMTESKDFYNSSITNGPFPIKYIDFPYIKKDDILAPREDVKRYKVNEIKDSYGHKF